MILLRYWKTSNKGRSAMGYMQTLITHIHCLFLGRSIRLPEPYKYFKISDIFLFFLSCSHFRLSTVFKPSYMKL